MNAGISWPDAMAGVYSNVSFGEGFFWVGGQKNAEFGVGGIIESSGPTRFFGGVG